MYPTVTCQRMDSLWQGDVLWQNLLAWKCVTYYDILRILWQNVTKLFYNSNWRTQLRVKLMLIHHSEVWGQCSIFTLCHTCIVICWAKYSVSVLLGLHLFYTASSGGSFFSQIVTKAKLNMQKAQKAVTIETSLWHFEHFEMWQIVTWHYTWIHSLSGLTWRPGRDWARWPWDWVTSSCWWRQQSQPESNSTRT